MHQDKIEQAQEKMEELRQELRTQVQEEVRANIRTRTWRRVLLRVGGCCGIYLLALLTIPTLAAYLVARTGLVTVPWLSERVAHERLPSRIVTAVAVEPGELLAAKFRAAVRPGKWPTEVTLSFSEAELSGLLQAGLAGLNVFTPEMRAAAQVALNGERVELALRVPAVGGGSATGLIRGIPAVRDGKPAVTLEDAAIGNFGVPKFLAQALLDSYLKRIDVRRLGGSSAQPSFALERIAVMNGQLQITLRAATP